jgi:Tryptophan-associated transmembrane protein (Trp_oprn_chp)
MTFLRSRRGLALVIVVCAAAAAAVLLAASRTWSHVVTPRPAPFPPLTTERTGASLEPWLPPLAIVGLAGAGALVAVRGRLRVALGIVLILIGVVTTVLSFRTMSMWSALSAGGGVVIALAGLATVRCSAQWPAMGARYERPAAQPERKPVTQAELWDALDRGEDPTTGTTTETTT